MWNSITLGHFFILINLPLNEKPIEKSLHDEDIHPMNNTSGKV